MKCHITTEIVMWQFACEIVPKSFDNNKHIAERFPLRITVVCFTTIRITILPGFPGHILFFGPCPGGFSEKLTQTRAWEWHCGVGHPRSSPPRRCRLVLVSGLNREDVEWAKYRSNNACVGVLDGTAAPCY